MLKRHFALILILALAMAIGCSGSDASEIRTITIVPKTAPAGEDINVTIMAQYQGQPARVSLTFEIRHEEHPGRHTAYPRRQVHGSAMITLRMPDEPGRYTLRAFGIDDQGRTFTGDTSIKVENASFVILQTDKPTCQPGQRLNLRAISIDRDLRPAPSDITFNVKDAGGAVVHRRTVSTGPYGMASDNIPISTEPRTSEWTITAEDPASRTGGKTVLAGHYILPRYSVKVTPHRLKSASGQKISGSVTAQYTSGRTAGGEFTITAFYQEDRDGRWIQGNRLLSLV